MQRLAVLQKKCFCRSRTTQTEVGSFSWLKAVSSLASHSSNFLYINITTLNKLHLNLMLLAFRQNSLTEHLVTEHQIYIFIYSIYSFEGYTGNVSSLNNVVYLTLDKETFKLNKVAIWKHVITQSPRRWNVFLYFLLARKSLPLLPCVVHAKCILRA